MIYSNQGYNTAENAIHLYFRNTPCQSADGESFVTICGQKVGINMKKVNLAFAGFRHGHIYSLLDWAEKNENINITGGFESYAPDRETAEKDHGVKFNYSSYEEILNDTGVDAVAIGNYYQARGKMVIDALKAGKHVIVDKPIAIEVDELEEIIKLKNEKKLEVFVMLDLRYNKNVNAAKKLIDDGEIGEINNICFGGQHPLLRDTRACWYFEEGKHGGTINDIAVHGIDLIRYLTKSEVKEINSARCWNKFAGDVPHFKDSGMFMLTLESGAGVIADVSYAVPDSIGYDLEYYWEFKIWGTKGLIVFSAYKDGVKLYKNGNKEVVVTEPSEIETDITVSFVDAINGKTPAFINTEESLKSSMQTLKIQKKADEN